LIELIEERGARVDYHDPFVPVIPRTREHATLAGRQSQSLDAENVGRYDAVLIATDHDMVDYPALVAAAKIVVDSRNVCARTGAFAGNVIKV